MRSLRVSLTTVGAGEHALKAYSQEDAQEAAMSDPEVMVRVEGAVGRLTLDRPRALHSLTQDMCGRIVGALLAWREDPKVHTILIDHAGDRGFCAGADVKAIAADAAYAKAFFRLEYQMNLLLFRYPKPVIALMDGVTM